MSDRTLRYNVTEMPAATASAFHAHDHAACARGTLAEAERSASARGLRLTPVRRRTLEILLESHQAIGAYDILDRLGADGFGSQPPVAYRALDFLVQHGFAHRIRRLNAFAACLHPGQPHVPAFFICDGCGAMAETEAAEVSHAMDEAAGRLGFAVDRISVEATGLCPACQAAS